MRMNIQKMRSTQGHVPSLAEWRGCAIQKEINNNDVMPHLGVILPFAAQGASVVAEHCSLEGILECVKLRMIFHF